MHLLWWIIVGLIAGWATGKIMRGSGYGPLMDIVIGIVGAVVGGWIMRALGFSGQGGMLYTILVAILGAVILTWVFRLVTGSGRPSGSGKSSLAFDVVFAEGQRRFMETLTPYARQFLPTLPRPQSEPSPRQVSRSRWPNSGVVGCLISTRACASNSA